MPKIGLRTVKTAIAIYICAMIYVLLLLINEEIAKGWYTPFFAGLGTAYSIYPDKKSSIIQAKNRSVASIFGGVFGMILILGYEGAINTINPGLNQTLDLVIRYTIVAICAVGVVQITLLFKQPATTFVAILTYLSVTINAAPNIPTWQFALNRILSTMVGVCVALAVNLFTLPHFRNKKALFVIGIDGILTTDDSKISGFYKYKMNNLLFDGANITLFTTRTPTSLAPLMEDVNLRLPVICMNGACVYDVCQKSYLFVQNIDVKISCKIRAYLQEQNVTPFINIVKDDLLHIYNTRLDNAGEVHYFKERKNSAFCACLVAEAPKDVEVTYFLCVLEEFEATRIRQALEMKEFNKEIDCQVYSFQAHEDFVFLKIYSSQINDLKALDILKSNNDRSKVIALSTDEHAHSLVAKSDLVLTNKDYNSIDNVTKLSQEKSITNIFKKMARIYHKRNLM